MTTNAFLLSWDCNGLEGCVPITQYEDMDKQNFMDVLAGKSKSENPLGRIISMMTLRARFNPQRNYEIYAIDCDHSITGDQWRVMFDDNPQGMADLVREKGIKIYSDRSTTARKIV